MECRTIKELKDWLNQFNEDSVVWAYEGEVQGIIVEQGTPRKKQYCFHNESIYSDDIIV